MAGNSHSLRNGIIYVLLGGVMLIGIVVNNAILIVHQMLNNIKSGMEEREALLVSCQTRLRPIMMTVAAIVAGLIPIMLGSGTGSELLTRIAAPMLGGMFSATLLTLAVVPAMFLLWQRSRHRSQE